MGFGLLFIGYFIAFLMSVNSYGFAFELIGFAIILKALEKLSEYKHRLSSAMLPLFLLSLCSLFDAGAKISELLSIKTPLFSESISFWVSVISEIIAIAFHVILLEGIRGIARDAEEQKLSSRAVGCIVLVAATKLFNLTLIMLGVVSSVATTQAFAVLTKFALLAHICYPLAILAFIYACYADLCAPEDVDMAPRPSRFGFINRWRERRQQRETELRQNKSEASDQDTPDIDNEQRK